MKELYQSSSQEPIEFGPIVLASDHISPATGLTLTVTISKNGGSFAAPSGTVSEVGNGYYKIAANTTDTNTLGTLVVHATGTGADPFDREYNVVAFNPLNASLGLLLDLINFTSNTRSVWLRQVTLVGTTTGIVTADTYVPYTLYNGAIAYQSTTLGTPVYLWSNGANYIASTTLGTNGAAYLQSPGSQVASGAGVAYTLGGTAGGSSLAADIAGITTGTSQVDGFTSNGVAALQAALANRTINVISPLVISADGVPTITVVAGDDYYNSDGRAIQLPPLVGTWPDWTSAVATVEFGSLTIPAVITTATGNSRVIYFELPTASTTALAATTDDASDYSVLFDVVVTLSNGHRTTVINNGVMVLLPNV